VYFYAVDLMDSSMKKKAFFLLFVMLFAMGTLMAQDEPASVANNRNKQIHNLLDYRFRGGFYSFERLFLQTAKYTDQARTNCVIGIMVVSFQVDCQGNVRNVRIKNPLHYGLDEEISKFMKATQGHWNACHDNKYTRFTVPIQFTMEGTRTDSIDAVISLVGKNPGYVCSGDNYFLQKAKEALAKKKGKRAQSFIATLIRRNPYSTEYFEMMKQAMELANKGKKGKKKKK
jgi:TonB family protein